MVATHELTVPKSIPMTLSMAHLALFLSALRLTNIFQGTQNKQHRKANKMSELDLELYPSYLRRMAPSKGLSLRISSAARSAWYHSSRFSYWASKRVHTINVSRSALVSSKAARSKNDCCCHTTPPLFPPNRRLFENVYRWPSALPFSKRLPLGRLAPTR